MTTSKLPDGTGLIQGDAYLEPYRPILQARYTHFQNVRQSLAPDGDLKRDASLGHTYFGINPGEHDGQPGLWYREWAPGAEALFLIGDFNHWDRQATPLARDDFGVWSVFLPDVDGQPAIPHASMLKVHVVSRDDEQDRIPAYIRRVVQPQGEINYVGQHWAPADPYVWQHDHKHRPEGEGLRIYEAHVGMASEEGKVASFDEFRENVLPRIHSLGYNAVQLMAVQEHPYYGSFGYHVSNMFAVSSRFGTPEQLKQLIDEAHRLGLVVIMDIVHSHMVKNTAEGLNGFDGTGHQYFHAGARGDHDQWDSKCFDYSKQEVLRLLLSNVRYWQEEFRFDGFRFDGVTSMLYLDHGMGGSFSHYDQYFGGNIDGDALVYLQLANQLAHEIDPHAITVAEDMSGMPGMARPVDEGGLGFDYRLAMGVPDHWIKLLKEKPDEDWDLWGLYHVLTNRRWNENHIGYAESHDQAMVGDKTLAMWLMDQDLYDGMSSLHPANPVIERGIALHKMIRLITFALSGEGYLNFMGNEFGHPEWIDFPREGNNNSYHHARRQWSLPDTEHLRYKDLQTFDAAMQQLDQRFHILQDRFVEQLVVHDDTRQLVFRRGPLVFAFNFHATESFADLRIPVPDQADYQVVLSTDDQAFGGQGRVDPATQYVWQKQPMYGRDQSLQIYLPARTALVFAPNA